MQQLLKDNHYYTIKEDNTLISCYSFQKGIQFKVLYHSFENVTIDIAGIQIMANEYELYQTVAEF